MDNQSALLLNWSFDSYQEKCMDELRESLDVKTRDLEIAQLKALLSRVLQERDEALKSCQKACLEIALLHKQLQDPMRIEDVDRTGKNHLSLNNGLSSSNCEDSIGSVAEAELLVAPDKPLPEKGRFLQAVITAGPLLQNLLIAGGPLPEWRHPPPPMDSYQIPPPPLLMPRPPPAASEDGGRRGRKRGHQ